MAASRAESAAQEPQDRVVVTACDMCYNACTIQVRVRDGVAVQIAGVPGVAPNYGKLCAKGHAALFHLYSPSRLRHPLRRRNPKKGIGVDPRWERISWDEALGLLVDKLRAAREQDPRSLIAASFDGHSFVPLWAFLTGFGTPNFTTVSAGFFCGNGVHPVAYTVTGSNDVHPDLKRTNYLLQFGTHYGFVAQMNAMGLARELAEARDRGMRLVVVDPVVTAAAAQADEWVPIRPGTDAALALAMQQELLAAGLYDEPFLRQYTNAPYLIGPDGRYVRDPDTQHPLVWDQGAGQPRPYEAVPPEAVALEGHFQVHDQPCEPAFARLKAHLQRYTPEYAAGITSIPSPTIRRLAREFGEAAQIGATVRLEEHTFPLRPAVATWYRGVSAHAHAMHNGMAIAFLNALVGAVDVPGGLLNAAAAGPTWMPSATEDGLIRSNNPFTRHHRRPIPPGEVRPPETVELVELFPVSVYARVMLWLTTLAPEAYGLPYRPAVLVQCRTNLMATTADPPVMAEALRRIPFIVSFAIQHDETTEFADLVLPDAHGLERLAPFAHNPYLQYRHVPTPGGTWTFNLQQPVVPAQGEARYWVEVLYEVAERLGIQGEVYAAFNALAGLEGPARLDPARRYTWAEVCDQWARGWCGEGRGLAYFREHGYVELARRTAAQSYPRIFHQGRIPLYLEHFLGAGEAVARYTREHGIAWDTSDYVPLVEWRPCPPFEVNGTFDLWAVNYKVPFLTFSLTGENPWLLDLAERNGRIFPVSLHPETARRKGLREGDRVVLETPEGRRAEAVVRLTEGVHPEVVAIPSLLGRWGLSDPRARGRGVHYNSLITYRFDRLDMVSAALDACVRVRVSRRGA
ncbi:MAG: molybdopterin-dependent oxidoreductase [Deltaproteobacteria bacterium]|nr:molybdopterin-dependent oxidoreductase [Deltaproteobacteria bacterium]